MTALIATDHHAPEKNKRTLEMLNEEECETDLHKWRLEAKNGRQYASTSMNRTTTDES
jgi:hypothetical protein